MYLGQPAGPRRLGRQRGPASVRNRAIAVPAAGRPPRGEIRPFPGGGAPAAVNYQKAAVSMYSCPGASAALTPAFTDAENAPLCAMCEAPVQRRQLPDLRSVLTRPDGRLRY